MRIDHRGYPAYKDTKGKYQFDQYVLSIDHVQGDGQDILVKLVFALGILVGREILSPPPQRSAFLCPAGSPASGKNAMRQRSGRLHFRIICSGVCT